MHVRGGATRVVTFGARFIISMAAVALVGLGITVGPARADDPPKPPTQQAAPVDACTLLETTLTAEGKPAEAKPGETKTPDQVEAEKLAARQRALAKYANQTSWLRVKEGADRLVAPGTATFEIVDPRVAALPDLSKICVRVYSQTAARWDETRIARLSLAAPTSDVPKRLTVTFEVNAPDGVGLWTPVRYLVVAALQDGKEPALAHYWRDLRLTNHWLGIIWSLVLVVGAYVAIARATFGGSWGDLNDRKQLARFLNPVRISSASYGEASMSQLQVLLFTLIVGGLLFHLWLTTFVLSDISEDLLKLLGISAVGAVGARFAHTIKTAPNDQTWRYLIAKGWSEWPTVDESELANFRQLFLTDGRLDVYKFQTAIFTVVVACYVLSAGQSNLGEVKISETMLYLIGISQGVYVAGKAVTDRTTDLEAAAQKMIDLEPQIRQKEAALAPGAARPADLVALDEQYKAAATRAAQEFASLQNKLYPRDPALGPPPTTKVIGQIDPKFLWP